jgi:hypothetical protein
MIHKFGIFLFKSAIPAGGYERSCFESCSPNVGQKLT